MTARMPSILIVLTAWAAAQAAAPDDRALRLYLPRSVTVDAQTLTLGNICVVRSGDAALVEKASTVALGRAPLPQEELVLDRTTIFSRLATLGIRGEGVQLTGAEKVHIRLKEKDRVIPAAELLAAAQALLQRQAPPRQDCRWEPFAPAQELAVAGGSEARLVAALGGEAPAGCLAVTVSAQVGEQALGARQVVFKLVTPEAPASPPRQPGDAPAAPRTTPGPASGAAVNDSAKGSGAAGPAPQQGDAAASGPKPGVPRTGAFAAGAAPQLTSGAARLSRPVVVKASQLVQMRIQRAGLIISATGEAMQDGRTSDIIKVRNADTKRVISARVNEDATVEPVFEEIR